MKVVLRNVRQVARSTGWISNLPDGFEITIIEDQQEFIVVFQPLHGVGGALGEVPDISDLELGDLILAVLVDSRDKDGSGVNVSPFSLGKVPLALHVSRGRATIEEVSTYNTMPMEFSDSTLLQVLLSSRDVMTGREIGGDLFTDPTTREDVGLGVRESPFQVGDITLVPVLLTQVIRVLQVNGFVCAT